MSYAPKKIWRDPESMLAKRRAEILAEYSHYQLDPVRIGGEAISLELALLLGLIVDTSQAAAE